MIAVCIFGLFWFAFVEYPKARAHDDNLPISVTGKAKR
jgi:hypothetical protein